MPQLCVFVDLHDINLLLYKSSDEYWFDVFPYVYSGALFSASFNSDEFYLNVFESFCKSHNVKIEDCDIAVTGVLDAPLLVSPGNIEGLKKIKIKRSASLHEVITNIKNVYPIIVNNHLVCSRDFCFSSSAVRTMKKATEHLDLEEENFYANLELYPQVVSNELMIQIDIDTNLAQLMSAEFDKLNSINATKKHNKTPLQLGLSSLIPSDTPVILAGSRFSQRVVFPELDYLLMLSFFQSPGIFDIKFDRSNKFILTELLKMADEKIQISTDLTKVTNEATVITSKSAIECMITTEQGTSQLLQLEKNRLLVVPTAIDSRVHVNIKSRELGNVERLIDGSNVGLIFDTRDGKTINMQDIKVFLMSLKNFKEAGKPASEGLI